MATLSTRGSFVSWELTPKETLAGSQLTLTTRQLLQTMICMFAEQRLALTPDPTNLYLFYQQEAELKGKISILQELLDNSESADHQLSHPSVE